MARTRQVTVDLTATLSTLTGRRVLVGEIIDALGIGSSTYYEQRDDGRLVCADNLLRVAANLGLNPVELMLSCGLLNAGAITECSEKISAGTASAPSKRRLKRRVDLPPL